jgi:uncharacterized beta-barrel protein YwiB (DUF1934 family)
MKKVFLNFVSVIKQEGQEHKTKIFVPGVLSTLTDGNQLVFNDTSDNYVVKTRINYSDNHVYISRETNPPTRMTMMKDQYIPMVYPTQYGELEMQTFLTYLVTSEQGVHFKYKLIYQEAVLGEYEIKIDYKEG